MYGISDDLLDQYDYADDPVLQERLHRWDRVWIQAMISYARGISKFGLQMMAHQNRVAKDGANLLRHMGYSERAAYNFRASMLFHDIGKTHSTYNPSIWLLMDRPTPEQKIEQKKHARLGAEMWDSFAKERADLMDHPHYAVRRAVTLYHHERIDGKGPEGLIASSLPIFVQISCIIDAYDGDRIWRPHQPKRRSPREALRRMAGVDDPKYVGAFSGSLLGKYIDMKEKEYSMKVL